MNAGIHSIDPQLSLSVLFLAITEHRIQEIKLRRSEMEQENLSRQIEIVQLEEPERWDGLL